MRRSVSRKRALGFTLIELMITVAVIAILAGVAYPSYRQHIVRSNRSAAQSAMMDIANREQQFLLANRRYADTAALTAGGYALPSEVATKYTLDVAPETTPPGYTITMTPVVGGTQASDGALTLNAQGVKTPAGKWE